MTIASYVRWSFVSRAAVLRVDALLRAEAPLEALAPFEVLAPPETFEPFVFAMVRPSFAAG
jgi:hypothetical protein